MNCHEIATILEGTLLRQRNPQWLREAHRHAEQCPSCARLMALHRLEEHLTELPAIELSEVLMQTVMNQIAQPEPTAAPSSPQVWWEMVKYSAIVVGALALAVIHSFPTAKESWVSNSSSGGSWLTNLGPIRTVGILTYFTDHPLWVLLLAGAAALLLVFGLATSESQPPNVTSRSS